MKRVISVVIIAIASFAMIACDNTVKNTSRITAGDKSKMDSISYCVGFGNAIQFCAGMPDVKLDWNLVIDVCSQMLLVPIGEEKDDRHIEASETAVMFFDSTRLERLQKIKLEKQGGDPNKQIDMNAELDFIDIFESPEERERISWAIGYDMGYNIRKMPYHLQVHWFKQGMLDGTQLQNTAKVPEVQAFMSNYHEVVWPLINAEKSAKWLSEVSKELNVKQTESGLLYRIDEKGDENNIPNLYSTVTIDYESICYDGRVYASTYRKGKPSVVQVERLIKGWGEGLQLIGKGGKITLWIPARLAYGEDGNNFVGPNEAVQFNIEMLDVVTPNVQVQNAGFDTAPAKNKATKKSK